MSRRTAQTPAQSKDRFIEALAQGATIAEAATASGIARRTAYDLRQRDEAFALRWADAIENGTEVLERVARLRAVEGSDHLLIFLLKARRPEVYRERTEVKHAGQIQQQTAPSAKEMKILREMGMEPEFREAAAGASKFSMELERRMNEEGAS